jgi:hypothetical protein
VKNVPESNGKVGILGISYDGFTSLMALVNPHPALRAAVPINAMVDGWMGDDWFHNGAFRQDSLTYFSRSGGHARQRRSIGGRITTTTTTPGWPPAPPATWPKLHGLEQVGFAGKVMSHPAYDEFWQDQALDKILAKQGVTVPTMLVHSLWDQEDIYGNIALYKALKARQADNPNLYLVLGSLVSPSGAARRQRDRGDSLRQRHGGILPAHGAAAVSSIIISRTMRRRSPSRRSPHSRPARTAGWHCRTWPAAAALPGCASSIGSSICSPAAASASAPPRRRPARASRPMSPIPPSRSPTCRARFISAATRERDLANLAGERSARCRLAHRRAELRDAGARRRR